MIKKSICLTFLIIFMISCVPILQAADEAVPKAETPKENPKIYNVKTPYDEVTWMDVVKGQQKPPDASSICLWFNYRDLAPSSQVQSVWYYMGGGTPRRIGEGAFWMPSGANWGRTHLPFHAGRQYPNGNYEVFFYVDGALQSRMPFAWQGPRNYGGYAMSADYPGSSTGQFERAVDKYVGSPSDKK
jgi:hypothetical protein